MRRKCGLVLSGVCLATLVAPALALVIYGEREEFGPARDHERKAADKRRALAYLPGRVYLLEKHQSGFGHNSNEGVAAYQGGAEAVSRALAELAQLPADTVKEIHLLPAPGISRSLKRKVTQPCDFDIRWSSVETWAMEKNGRATGNHQATLTIYVDRAGPPPPLDPRAAQWIKDLDAERFVVRQAAFEKLADQRDAVWALLRRTLDAKEVTLEAHRRIELLLKRLEPIHAGRLQLPNNVPIFGVDELLKREADNWRSGDLAKSWHAANQICALSEFTEESFPLLVEMLQDRTHVRDLAVVAFELLGDRALGQLPQFGPLYRLRSWNRPRQYGKRMRPWRRRRRFLKTRGDRTGNGAWRLGSFYGNSRSNNENPKRVRADEKHWQFID